MDSRTGFVIMKKRPNRKILEPIRKERERERELAVSDVFVALVVKLLQNQGLFLVKTRIPKDVRNLNIWGLLQLSEIQLSKNILCQTTKRHHVYHSKDQQNIQPSKFNIDTQNSHFWKELPFPRTIILGALQPLDFQETYAFQTWNLKKKRSLAKIAPEKLPFGPNFGKQQVIFQPNHFFRGQNC